MVKILASCLLAVLSIGLAGRSQGQGNGSPPPYTVINVEQMDCHGCARRISTKLQAVAGVDKVQVDVEKKLLWVHPKAGQQPSPRGLWEAVESANDRPLWLQGPYGKFDKKPQS